MKSSFLIDNTKIGTNYPTYFIADIAANHDGDLEKAKALIHLAAESGANAAKFQNFTASKIVSDRGFNDLGSQKSHQAKWDKSVYQVYSEASIPWEWTPILKKCCDSAGIHYFSSPYDFGAVDMLDSYVPAYKIGSGDITWLEIIEYMSKKKKPTMLATGASSINDVKRAMETICKFNDEIVLMQCNTNYTASLENFKYINLNVLKTFEKLYPNVILGLSDHTPGHTTVLGAISLGARVIEKHFTDNTTRKGPDHAFSMDPITWKDMVLRSRELECSLGNGEKQIEENEKETVILQRRCIRAARKLSIGTKLKQDDIECLRPSSPNGILPHEINNVLGKVLKKGLEFGQHLNWSDLE